MGARHPVLTKAFFLLYSMFALLLGACGGGYGSGGGGSGPGGATCGGTYGTVCPPPTVSISAPAANATVSGTVSLTATAAAASQYDVTVSSVAFAVDGTSVGTATASPYTYMWNSTTVANGAHSITATVTDSAGDKATSAAVSVTVSNAGAAAVMEPGQIFPVPSSKASGTARVSLQPETGAVSGSVTLNGLTARAVTINAGFAGTTGEVVTTLAPRAGRPGEWEIPQGTTLSTEDATALMQGRLYVIATSAEHPSGELRGQLAPDSVRVAFSALAATPEEAALGVPASGVAATTVDSAARTLTVHVNTSGVEDATAARVTSDADGTKVAELARDSADPGHFATELAPLSAAGLAAFKAGRLSVSVSSAAAPAGAIRGQIPPEDATRGD
jgi:hypothetical protein